MTQNSFSGCFYATDYTQVSISSRLYARFLYKSLFGSFFLVTFWQKKHFRTKKRTHKPCWWNWLQFKLVKAYLQRGGWHQQLNYLRCKVSVGWLPLPLLSHFKSKLFSRKCWNCKRNTHKQYNNQWTDRILK